MMRKLLQSMFCLILGPLLIAQQVESPATNSAAQSPLPPPSANTSSRTVRIPMDTLVVLRLEQRISTADAKVGDKVHFTLVNDLAVEGRVIIPAGASCDLTIAKVWRATPENPYLVASIQFTAPILDLGHGQIVRLTNTNYAMRHDESDGVTRRDEILIWIASPVWFLPVLIQDANEKRTEAKANLAAVTPKNWKPCDAEHEKGEHFNYYFRRAVKIRADRIATSNSSTQLQ
jgi:hypothetical protein